MKLVDLVPPDSGSVRAAAASIFEAARAKSQHILGLESFKILKAYGIPVVKTIFAKT